MFGIVYDTGCIFVYMKWLLHCYTSWDHILQWINCPGTQLAPVDLCATGNRTWFLHTVPCLRVNDLLMAWAENSVEQTF